MILTKADPREIAQLKEAINKLTFDKRNKEITHVLDIYKMRRGRYKGIRIWCNLDLGTGERTDLFMTNQQYEVMQCMESEELPYKKLSAIDDTLVEE